MVLEILEKNSRFWKFVFEILNFLKSLKIISIKHDLARSCFQFWLKIGDEGDKISRKKFNIWNFFANFEKDIEF